IIRAMRLSVRVMCSCAFTWSKGSGMFSVMGMVRWQVSDDWLPKREYVAVRREHQQFALPVTLVHRSVYVARRQSIELRFQLSVDLIYVANVNVVSETASAGQRRVLAGLFPDSEAHGFAVHIGIVGEAQNCFEAQDVGEKFHSAIEVVDDHEWRDLDEIRHGCSPAGRLA